MYEKTIGSTQRGHESPITVQTEIIRLSMHIRRPECTLQQLGNQKEPTGLIYSPLDKLRDMERQCSPNTNILLAIRPQNGRLFRRTSVPYCSPRVSESLSDGCWTTGWLWKILYTEGYST